MRRKYNSIYDNSFNTELSYIQRYLGSEIETVLNPESNSIHGVDFDSIYVNMPQTEKHLIPFKHHMDSDRCVFLTGLTGCGKSSVINYVFHSDINNKVRVENRSLYILFSFDHAIAAREKEELTTYFINIIKETCEVIEKELERDGQKINTSRFYSYIKRVRADNLQHGMGIKKGTQSERLKHLAEKDPIEYYALLLKYYLTEFKKIDHVVFIVDDIESVGYQMELVPIDLGLTLWSCFKRQPTSTSKVWSSCVVISCRHYVYRMIQKHAIEAKYIIKSGIDSQTLESYPIDDEINITESVKLIDIIKKRVQALKIVKTDKRWDDAWTVVEHILTKVDDKFGDFILAICISNIRKSLSVLKKIVLNKRWIQRNWQADEETPGAFNIDSINQFNLSPPCLLRAIALGEGNIYTEDSIIPNVLFNTTDKQSDLITLIVFKAFLKQSNEKAISWRISLDRDKTARDLKEILPEKTHQYIDASIKFLIERRLLLRSKNQAQDDGLDINADNIDSIKQVYDAKGAFALWNQLGRSSVLLELFTDDIYIDYEGEIAERQNFSIFDQKTFERCIDFLFDMVELENKIRSTAHNRGLSKNVNNVIGSEFVTKQLLNGLIATRNAYFKSTNDYEKELNQIAKDIATKQSLINRDSN